MNRRVLPIAGAVVVVLLLGWYLEVWSPSGAHLKAARASQVTAQTQRESLFGTLAGLAAIQRKLPGLEAQVRAGENTVPTSVSLDSVIDQINAIAIADHILWSNEAQAVGTPVTTVAPATTVAPTTATSTATTTPVAAVVAPTVAVPVGGNTTVGLTLLVAGTYTDMLRFITDLEHLPRLILIDSLGYAPSTGLGGGVTTTIGAHAYYDNTPLPTLSASAKG